MEKDKRLMEISKWEILSEGKMGFVLMGGAMISKLSSVQSFSHVRLFATP